LAISNHKVRPPASPEILQEIADFLPPQMLELYKKMNGCYFFAMVKNDNELSLGLTIPPIETIQFFQTSDNPNYNFKGNVRFLPFEWSEPTDSTFFFLLESEEEDLNKAKIVYARSGEEYEYQVVCNSLEEWIEKAIAANFSIGWAIKDIPDYQSNKQKLGKLLGKKPTKKKIHPPGKRLRFDELRVTVIKSITKATKSTYFGNDFTLIEFDLGARGWVQSGRLKKIWKNDLYEKIKTGKLPLETILGKNATKEMAHSFAALCCSTAYQGVAEDTSIPYHTPMIMGLFLEFTLEETTLNIFDILDTWYQLFEDHLNQPIPFEKVKSRHKHDTFPLSNLFHAFIGLLVFRIIRKRKAEGNGTPELNKIQAIFKKRLPRYVFLNIRGAENNEFNNFLDKIDKVFSSEELFIDPWFEKEVSEYLADQIGLSDYPFYHHSRA